MANFDDSFDKISIIEGGYVNDPDDAGGETYCGISRRFHPYSKIWTIIDNYKKTYKTTKEINKALKQNKEVKKYIKRIYKSEYWDELFLDDVPSQDIADQLFDDAVNRGVKSAIIIAQAVCGMTITGKMNEALMINLKRYGTKK